MKIQHRRLLLGIVLSALLGSLWTAALAQTEKKPKLVGNITASRVTKDPKTGKETFTEAKQVNPGDVIRYVIRYRNVGDGPARNVALVGPVPRQTAYLDRTATGTEKNPPKGLRKDLQVLFSLDRGRTYQEPPIKYKVKLPDGKEEERVATPDMYTHVKWVIQGLLQPQETIQVEYRVKVK